MPRNENMIAALLRERDGYQSRDMGERVALVNKQLAHYGYVEPAAEPAGQATAEGAAEKRKAAEPEKQPRARQAPGKSTT